MKKNSEVIKAFVHGGTRTQGKNLKIINDKLIHFDVTIAQRIPSEHTKTGFRYIINMARHDGWIRKSQNAVVKEINNRLVMGYSVVKSIKKGVIDLNG